MSSVVLSHRDIAFLLYEWLHLDGVLARPAYSELSRWTHEHLFATGLPLTIPRFDLLDRADDALLTLDPAWL